MTFLIFGLVLAAMIVAFAAVFIPVFIANRASDSDDAEPTPTTTPTPLPPTPAPVFVNVTTISKTAAHPHFGAGSAFGFSVDGIEGATLQLNRGQLYVFQLDASMLGHPFHFSTAEQGGVGSPLLAGTFVPSDTGDVEVAFDESHPDDFFYACAIHDYMGGQVTLA